MDLPEPSLIRIDGREPSTEQLARLAFGAYGHFTAMQVRDRRVRGLALHLTRLADANREMFDADLGRDGVRGLMANALGDDIIDASLRVYILGDMPGDPITTVVAIRPPVEPPRQVRLLSVDYQRTAPHIKRAGDFGQGFHGRYAERRGFDDALFAGSGGVISETSIANIGFFDGTAVVWPQAQMLRGITLQLIEPRLRDAGLPSRHSVVHLSDVPAFTAAFVMNSQGIAAVTGIDDHDLAVDSQLLASLKLAYGKVPWDALAT